MTDNMAKLIDTHAHLQFKAYDADRDEVVKRNSEELAAVINVGTSIDASEKAIQLAKKVSNFYASVAIHPHHVDQWNDETFQRLETLAKTEKVVAVGEIGLDVHHYENYPKPNLTTQTKILHQQIGIAQKLKLPVILHCRDAYGQLYKEIKPNRGKISGVVHCFMGTWEQAKKFLDLGFYISFTGNLTYKGNGTLREIAKKVPDERILTETDAPYLPPEPHRGERNEPIYVKMVASTLASIKNWSLEESAKITTNNAKNLFKIS
jgi:TatD DNase family protein